MEPVSFYSEEGPLNKSRDGQEPAASHPRVQKALVWARQRAVQLPVWSQGLLAGSSVHLWLLAGRQLTSWLQG